MEIEATYFTTIDDFVDQKDDSKYILFVGSNTKIDLKKITKIEQSILGAVFPQIIFNNSVYDEGLIAIKISENMRTYFIEDMKNKSFENIDFKEIKSAITIIDAFSDYKDEYLQMLFQKLGVHSKILGGGAGVLDTEKRSVIFDNKRFYKNCAILITLKNEINLSIRHGWEHLQGPFIVTSSHNNILEKIDYKDAFDVYKEVIKEDSGIILDENNFKKISKNYPIGIVKYRKEEIVRDPLSLKGKSLILAGKITNNSIINILKGKNETLLKASREATEEVLSCNSEFVMMFDCITRKDFLEDKFDEELNSIYKKSLAKNFIGAITVGEIANEGNKYINFLNKTCVIGGVCF